MVWEISNRGDQFCREIADRHYNRQHIGSPQFVPPGRCLVMKAVTETGVALWVSSWPYAEYTHHEWAGAWICTLFRNEGAGIASEMIKEAVAATKYYWGTPPDLGMVTFINKEKVKPIMRRGEKHYGYTYEKAGFRLVGETKVNHLLAYQLLPKDMPNAEIPNGYQMKFV